MEFYFIFLAISVYCYTHDEALNACLPSQYLDDNGKCYDCTTNCVKCESENKCSECSDSYFLDEESGHCFSCPFQCTQCTSYQNCTSCISADPVDGVCYYCGYLCNTCTPDGCVECTLDSYLEDNKCTYCGEGCSECEGPDECLVCNSSHMMINGKCVYIENCIVFDEMECFGCELGYYLYDGICLACDSSCKYCNSYDECTECFYA